MTQSLTSAVRAALPQKKMIVTDDMPSCRKCRSADDRLSGAAVAKDKNTLSINPEK
jgi:hypothetical protein